MQAAVELARGQRPSGINGKYVNEAKGIEQDAIYVDVIPVTQENLYEVIVKSGFHRLEDVYRNVPPGSVADGLRLDPSCAPAPFWGPGTGFRTGLSWERSRGRAGIGQDAP